MDDEEGDDDSGEATQEWQDSGDLELCAVEEVPRSGTGQVGANARSDLPPGLGVVTSDDAWWAQFLDLVPACDPLSEKMSRDVTMSVPLPDTSNRVCPRGVRDDRVGVGGSGSE